MIGHVAVAGQDRVPVRSPFAGRLIEVVAWHGERVLHRQRIAWLRIAAYPSGGPTRFVVARDGLP